MTGVSLFDSHVSIRRTRWHITIYRLFTLCGQYPVLKVPAGPRPAAPPGWDQLPLRAARGSILRASPPPVNRILEIFSRARFRGPRPRPGRCGSENSTPAAGAGQGGSGIFPQNQCKQLLQPPNAERPSSCERRGAPSDLIRRLEYPHAARQPS